MSPSARRILIPIFVSILALGVVASMILPRLAKQKPTAPADEETPAAAVTEEPGAQAPAEDESEPAASGETAEPTVTEGAPETPEPEPVVEQPAGPTIEASDESLSGLYARAPAVGVSGHAAPTQSMGSLDPDHAAMELQFSRAGAGLSSIAFADVWETVETRRQARAYRSGRSPDPPDEGLRYILQEERLLTNLARGAGFMVPAMAAQQVTINGQAVPVFDYPVVKTTDEDGDVKWEQLEDDSGNPVFHWAETGPGEFQTEVVNAAGEAVLRITRRFILGESYDITIEQRLENLTSIPLEVQWSQYGPDSLRMDRSRYMDRRRYRFGYLADPSIFPAGSPDANVVRANDNKVLMERTAILKRWKKAGSATDAAARIEHLTLWPNQRSLEERYTLSWFGATNRYFALAVHPVLDEQGGGDRVLTDVVGRIMFEVSDTLNPATGAPDETIFTFLVSPTQVISPGAELPLDIGVYAGPLDRFVLGENQPYIALSMDKLILYQMSSCCAICTFQWLAIGLLEFLTFLKTYVVFDWAVAIVILVIIVRTLLHPLTKKSQISMQRFGKAMGELKPEIDKLQKKYGHDPKRMQQEQMRLMRERGANPMQMLGCMPMFLQMPIWIALYAMLYFAFDLRQVPAFYGVFQLFWDWPFLADLSAADHCLWEFEQPFRFFMWNITGINVLPILMGAIFYVQQKYMSPPPSPTMTKEQLSQQKMMKVMMVVMFPVMLYSAPSGLTLYILTSSTIGILESRYIRRHIKEMDLNPPKKKPKRKSRIKDAQGRAYAAAMKRMEEKRRRKQIGPEKKYKKRK